MNETVVYQWEQAIAEHVPSLKSWQVAHVALMSYGVVKAEGSQQQKVARQMRVREKIDSAARRLRRFLANRRFPTTAFFRTMVADADGHLRIGVRSGGDTGVRQGNPRLARWH